MNTIVSRFAGWARSPFDHSRSELARAYHVSGKRRFCPVCGHSSRKFRRYGAVPREEAQCVHCGALERHRLLWLFVTRRTDLFDGKAKIVLHVAPESCLASRFAQRLGKSYLTADLFAPDAMVRMDISDIAYPDEYFDVIYCSHVLEHVPDDSKAMREFHRTLKPTGWAILLVPIVAETTFEDPSIVDPQERLVAYGQEDHVRCYGRDYADRLRGAGFTVEIIKVGDLVSKDDATQMGLTAASGDIYCCTRGCPED